MSLVALKYFPQPNLRQEGMWYRIKMLSFAKRESLWLMNLDGVELYGCPPGGGNFPFNVKVNLKPALSIWLSASQGAQCRLYSHGALPLWDTYRHADLFLFPSVCGHSARRKKKNAVSCSRLCKISEKRSQSLLNCCTKKKNIYIWTFLMTTDRI